MITLMIERRRELATLRQPRRRAAADPGHGDDRSGDASAWSARSSAFSPASALALILIYVINVQSLG